MDRSTDASEISLGGETLKGTTAKFVTVLVGFVGTILFARILGPSAYGGFYLLLAVVEIVDRPIRGWAKAGKKRFSEANSDDRRIVGGVLLFTAGFLVVAILGGFLAEPWLHSYTGLDHSPVLFAVLIASTTGYISVRSFVEARGLMGIATWSNTLRNWLAFPLQLGLILGGLGVAGMAYGYATATVLAIPVVAYFAATAPTFPTRETVRSLWSYARYSIPVDFLGKAYSRFDLILLGMLLTPAAASYYDVAYRVTLPATFIAGVAAGGLMARVSNLRSKDETFGSDIENTLAFSGVLAFPIFFGALAIADELILTLFGGEYAPAGLLLIGIALYRVVKSQTTPLMAVVDGLDRPDVNLRLSAITLGFNVVTGVLLVLWIGAIGVVISTVFAELLRYVFLVRFLKATHPTIELFPRPIVEQCAAGITMFALVAAVGTAYPIRSWLGLLFVLGVGAATYALALVVISSYHRTLATTALRGLPHPSLRS